MRRALYASAFLYVSNKKTAAVSKATVIGAEKGTPHLF